MPKAKALMPQKEYLEEMGNKCPHCRSKNVVGLAFDSDCDYAWRQVECHDCGEIWTENFKMTGYETN